jgi:hypothetical protein
MQAQSDPNSTAAASPWKPVRHPEDNWFDQPTAKHRFFLDTTSPEAFAQALLFARNFYTGNANGYGLADSDIAQIICARHRSTAFAFNDAMWAKYGATLSERANGFVDPKTKQAPTGNVFCSVSASSEKPAVYAYQSPTATVKGVRGRIAARPVRAGIRVRRGHDVGDAVSGRRMGRTGRHRRTSLARSAQ